MRDAVLLIGWLFFTALSPAAQKSAPTSSPSQADFLPAGPFLFEPGAIHPTYMDAFDDRPVVKSPDGRFEVTVSGPKESLGAWVTVTPTGFLAPGVPFRAWPISSDVDVLWRPDSQAFALTDNRYSNLSYTLVFGTDFRMGESGPPLGVPITDLTPIVRKAFEERPPKYYGTDNYDTHHFYAKALRWVGNDDLLVGVSAITSGPPTFPNRGVKEWNVAYLVDVPHKTVAHEVSESQLLSQYGIRVFDK